MVIEPEEAYLEQTGAADRRRQHQVDQPVGRLSGQSGGLVDVDADRLVRAHQSVGQVCGDTPVKLATLLWSVDR
jgi:hypothetical protein